MSRKPRIEVSPSRVVAYLRVSTDEQHLGPEAQREAVARWCAANGAELVGTFEDLGVSGGVELDKRPQLLAALDALRERGAGVLLVSKRDRLARDTMVAGMIQRLVEKAGARVLAADGTGNGEGPEAMLMRGIIDCFAAYERALIRARTTGALAVKRGRGERIGGIPYGCRLALDGAHLEPEPAEREVLARVSQLRTDGLTVRSIAERLNAEGIPARGNRWHPTTVARILRRAA